MPRFRDKLARRIAKTGSHLCVGLDPRPDGGVAEARPFLLDVIQETAPHAAALKPNMAYFEAMGHRGIALLEDLLQEVPDELPVILDAKRGDIGETQRYYAKAFFDGMNVDAVTLSPYMGFDSVEPFLHHEGRGVYLLAVTSNPGSHDIQRRSLAEGGEVFSLVRDFARRADAEGLPGDVGFVVGLTNADPELLRGFGDAPLLIPGMGAQGGDPALWRQAGRSAPDVINVSRGILYQEPEKTFSDKAKEYAKAIAGNH